MVTGGVDESDLTQWRTQMGQAAAALLDTDRGVAEVHPGWWLALSGLPSADLNMVLIHEADEPALARVLDRVAALNCPTLAMFAGEGRKLAGGLPPGWQAVGSMPIMTVELAHAPRTPDPRVRKARLEDAPVISTLTSAAYGIDQEYIEIVFSSVSDRDSLAEFWVLEDDGEAVSAVMSARVADTVSLWCMATPPPVRTTRSRSCAARERVALRRARRGRHRAARRDPGRGAALPRNRLDSD